jgi:predicted lipid-binding transport protein (Tim44 family)
MILTAGSRGVRSRSTPARPGAHVPVPVLVPAPAVVLPVSPAPRASPWMAPAVGLVVGTLIGNVLFGVFGQGVHDGSVRPVDVGLGLLVLVLLIMRFRLVARARSTRTSLDAASRTDVPEATVTAEDEPGPGSDLDQGVRDIRRTDPGFDPTRFAGYTGMIFRDAHTAWMMRDISSLRQRLTAEMYAALEGQCERLRSARRSSRVNAVDVRSEITEAWQESGQDFVTAYIAGSMIDYTVDDASGVPVDGSRTIPRDVNEFWTFTRPAGLNFWMLSAIQTS